MIWWPTSMTLPMAPLSEVKTTWLSSTTASCGERHSSVLSCAFLIDSVPSASSLPPVRHRLDTQTATASTWLDWGTLSPFKLRLTYIQERGLQHIIDDVYQRCKAQVELPKEANVNQVKAIYDPFTTEEISERISKLLTPKDMKAEVKVVFQSIEGLHSACPNNTGDWYFTGNFPTPGGNKVVNRAFVYYVEGRNERAY